MLGDILVFNHLSFAGEVWPSLWNALSTAPSVVSGKTEELLKGRELAFVKSMCEGYNCQRAGIHDEIDCGMFLLYSCYAFSNFTILSSTIYGASYG